MSLLKTWAKVGCVLIVGILLESAIAAPAMPSATQNTDTVATVRSLLQQIADTNSNFQKQFHDILSNESLQQQTPHATAVLCADSRVNMDILSETPTGEIFVIRNVGNQISTAAGSVDYGVEHLKTQLLLIIGHSGCGAIKAAMGDYSGLAPDLKKELDTLEVDPKATLEKNIIRNVIHQVAVGVTEFKTAVDSGQVVVIGMVYDMHNAFGHGHGKLFLVDINNKVDTQTLRDSEYIKGISGLEILD